MSSVVKVSALMTSDAVSTPLSTALTH